MKLTMGGLLALAALCLTIVVAANVAAESPVEVLTDASGDVAVEVAGQGTANPTPRLATLDLVAASVLEEQADFVFTLTLAELDPVGEPPLAESAFYAIEFQQSDVTYQVQLGRIRSQEAGVFGALVRVEPENDRTYFIDYLAVEADVAAATLSTRVAREYLIDSHGAKPYPGTALTGFIATSQGFMEIFSPSGFLPVPQYTLRDRMPDDGAGAVGVPIVFGPEQRGSAKLASPLPFRQSNGEAATFVFTVEARNVGQSAQTYELQITKPPSGWEIEIRESLLQIAPGGAISVPILVTTPFNHEHGAVKSFLVRMVGRDDNSLAELEMGIRYPLVPQPAGHHNTLWLHSAKFSEDPMVQVFATAFGFNTEYGWMNAMMDDVGDQRISLPSEPPFDFTPTTTGFRWRIVLNPDLAMGLDFEMEKTGRFIVQIQNNLPMPSASLSGELVHYVGSTVDEFGGRSGGTRNGLATFAASPVADVAAAQTTTYELVLTPSPVADLVPYSKESALQLELVLATSRPDYFTGRDSPMLLHGASLELPLREYHDPVDASFASQNELQLRVVSESDRVINPGKTALYWFQIENRGDARELDLRISGRNVDWAKPVGPTRLAVSANSNTTFAVAVAVPSGAASGEVLDIIVEADAGVGVRSLARVFGTVATSPERDDEKGEAEALAAEYDAKSTPIPALVALVAIAWAARRARAHA